MAEEGASRKPPASLDSLGKEELITRCRSLLQLAQKAKTAKDDAQKRCEAIEENSKKEKASLEENIATLQSKNEDTEDLLKAKQRKLDRLSDENDSLLGQIDSYCAQLKDAANSETKVKTELQKVQNELQKAEQDFKAEKKKTSELEKEAKSAKSRADQLSKELEGEKSKRSKLEVSAAKGMEAEANLICLRESESNLSRRVKELEGLLGMEKKLNADKNLQLATISEKLLEAENLVQEKEEKVRLLEADKSKMDDSLEKDRIHNELLEEQAQLQSSIEGIKSKCSQLEAEKVTQREQLEQMELSRIAASEEQKALEQKNSGLIEELNQLTEEMKKRGERIDKLEQCTVDHQNRARELERQKTELEATAAQTSGKLEDSEKKQKELEDIQVDLRRELKSQSEALETSKEQESLKEAGLEELTVKLKETEKLKREALEEIEGVNREIVCLKDQVASLSNYLENKQKEILSLEEKVSHFEKYIEEKDSHASSANKRVQELENILVEKRKEEESVNLGAKLEEADQAVELQSSKVEDLTSSLKELQSSLKSQTEESDIREKTLSVTITDLESLLASKDAEVLGLKNDLSGKESDVYELQNKIKDLEKASQETDGENLIEMKKTAEEKAELESELAKVKETLGEELEKNRVINEEKERALADLNKEMEKVTQEKEHFRDQITRLVKDHTKGEEKLASSEARTTELEQKISSQEEAIDVLKRTCNSLREEMATTMKSENLNNSSAAEQEDGRSEMMSTSTVSRVEEHSRMKDVEDSFEDRYSKLKLIAIKLKKKCGEQAKIIQELQNSRKAKAEEDLSGGNVNKDKVASLTKNFELLQGQYDTVVDKLESTEAEVKQLTKDLEASLAECLSSKQRAEECLQATSNAKTELARVEEKARDAESRLRSVEVTAEEERRERVALEERAREQEGTAAQLRERAGASFLLEETVASLKLQVAQVEESLGKERERADHANQVLASTRSNLATAESDLMRARSEAEEAQTRWQESVRTGEVLQGQLAEAVQDAERTSGGERLKVQQLQRQVAALEASSSATAQQFSEKEVELEKISKEFESYKLRAQSVLKQSKDQQVEREAAKKQEEIFAMEKLNDALNEKLKSLSMEVKTVQVERQTLQEEHDRLMGRQSLLLQELASKEKGWRERGDEAEARVRQAELEKGEAVERMQRNVETLKQGHEQEVELQKAAHCKELSKIQQQLDSSENEVIRLELVLAKEQEARRALTLSMEETGGRLGHDYQAGGSGRVGFDNSLDISQIEREAAEGQEIEPITPSLPWASSVTSPLPLEQLLAQADPTSDHMSDIPRSGNSSRAGGSERQVAHLAALLSEAETQNGRLEKLVEVLKEEIRTYQRSEERHKHIENLEYVKNVILKFITLTGPGEKAALVPVLKTILRLKQEEVAQVEELVRKEGEIGTGEPETWGGYLGLWSTGP